MNGAALDPKRCDRARIARDPRFDGAFYTGVRTTRIYCRPTCPVKPARSENVVFFPTAAAAERAGFRPCLRCRPEAAPGTPAWRGAAATVSRALRLIERGFLDGDARVEDLADALGMTARHLRRLFLRHAGASPTAVRRARLKRRGRRNPRALPRGEGRPDRALVGRAVAETRAPWHSSAGRGRPWQRAR